MYLSAELPARGARPLARVLILDPGPDGEPRAALVLPGRLPVLCASLSAATTALREGASHG